MEDGRDHVRSEMCCGAHGDGHEMIPDIRGGYGGLDKSPDEWFFAVSTSQYVPGTQPDASERSCMSDTVLKISKNREFLFVKLRTNLAKKKSN